MIRENHSYNKPIFIYRWVTSNNHYDFVFFIQRLHTSTLKLAYNLSIDGWVTSEVRSNADSENPLLSSPFFPRNIDQWIICSNISQNFRDTMC